MHNIHSPGSFVMLTSALAIATACALAPTAAAASVASPLGAVQPPPAPAEPQEEPCPGGEPKPCGASAQERDSVDSDRENAQKDIDAAKGDIAEAKEKIAECPPGSKQCMENLTGDGAEQRKGMEVVQHALDDFQAVPSDNAASVMDETCDTFAAALPAAITASDDSALLTNVCELMNP
ncbi:hypothetical protein AB0M44_42440 [Streptosporangium subroseum]|uniref:hypothetical protein n=1 Tax=Streptosporangium subroseum TaxID=106412 RepID=UPI00341A0B8D